MPLVRGFRAPGACGRAFPGWELTKTQLVSRRIAFRAMQVAIVAAGILFLLMLVSRQAHAATRDDLPAPAPSAPSVLPSPDSGGATVSSAVSSVTGARPGAPAPQAATPPPAVAQAAVAQAAVPQAAGTAPTGRAVKAVTSELTAATSQVVPATSGGRTEASGGSSAPPAKSTASAAGTVIGSATSPIAAAAKAAPWLLATWPR
jgi:hypothetical protein